MWLNEQRMCIRSDVLNLRGRLVDWRVWMTCALMIDPPLWRCTTDMTQRIFSWPEHPIFLYLSSLCMPLLNIEVGHPIYWEILVCCVVGRWQWVKVNRRWHCSFCMTVQAMVTGSVWRTCILLLHGCQHLRRYMAQEFAFFAICAHSFAPTTPVFAGCASWLHHKNDNA